MNVLYSPTSSYFSKPKQEYLIFEGDTNQHIVYLTNLNFYLIFLFYFSIFILPFLRLKPPHRAAASNNLIPVPLHSACKLQTTGHLYNVILTNCVYLSQNFAH